MAEGTYEFEVMRAELLGIQPPDRAVFEEHQKERMSAEQEEIDTEQTKVILKSYNHRGNELIPIDSSYWTLFQELDAQDETLKSGSGKLDDLNQILSITQQKLHKFKVSCCLYCVHGVKIIYNFIIRASVGV